jgi:hypothetical protein
MESIFNKLDLEIGEGSNTAFLSENGVKQDGTTPMYRDVDGTLWAISGHSHAGIIAMFKGTGVEDLQQIYTIQTNFCVGHCDYAFNGVRYPDGIKARGSVWPFGLYICPKTHRFFVFFHNETGWNGKGTAYDAYGECETPKMDSDFRHIGLMHSDDEGRNWTFDRWVLSGEKPCFTELYNPAEDIAIGQRAKQIELGTGDFSLYVEPDGEYMYLIYNNIHFDVEKVKWSSCNVYIARTRKRDDGIMGDFVKYYNGAFCEPGNFGKETPILKNAWHARIVWLEKYKKYVISYCPANPNADVPSKLIADVMKLRCSDDMLNWSEEMTATRNGEPFGNHYVAILPNDKEGQMTVVKEDEFWILTNHNGTTVKKYPAKFTTK